LLVRALAGPFQPAKYHDHYQGNLRALLDAKIQGEELEERASKPVLAPVVDILEALKASLAVKKNPELAAMQNQPAELRRKKRSRAVG
jgi:DNA end-binding protein Ku